MIDDDTHDKLTKAYIEYFKNNEKWVRRRSVRTYYATQRHLKQIKKLAHQLEKENREIFNQKKGKKDS